MDQFFHQLLDALTMAAGMAWQVGWSLILGFTLSGAIQAFVPAEKMRQWLGRDGVREIALATVAGAASSSCSYASAATSRTLFKKGAALVPALAYLFASTNLVIELGVILYLLMGWQFAAAEWIGGVVLVAIMSLLVRLTYPRRLAEAARHHEEKKSGHDHGGMAAEKDGPLAAVARNVAMDWSMLWKDLLAGFLIAGILSAFVPADFWQSLFLHDASPWLRVPANAVIAPLIATVSFVCSIGNVPMAAILWGAGMSFGGVLSFLYADLIILPLLDVYRRYYGGRMAAYIGVIFYVTMVLAGLTVDLLFRAAGWVPPTAPNMKARITTFAVDYRFWLNLLFGALALYFWHLNRSRNEEPHPRID